MAPPSAVEVLPAASALSEVDVSVEATGGTTDPESFFLRLTKISAAITSTRSRISHRHGFMVPDATPLPTQRNHGQIQLQAVGRGLQQHDQSSPSLPLLWSAVASRSATRLCSPSWEPDRHFDQRKSKKVCETGLEPVSASGGSDMTDGNENTEQSPSEKSKKSVGNGYHSHFGVRTT